MARQKPKVIGIRLNEDDYYSFLAEAAKNKLPVSVWCEQKIKGSLLSDKADNVSLVAEKGSFIPKEVVNSLGFNAASVKPNIVFANSSMGLKPICFVNVPELPEIPLDKYLFTNNGFYVKEGGSYKKMKNKIVSVSKNHSMISTLVGDIDIVSNGDSQGRNSFILAYKKDGKKYVMKRDFI